MKVTTLSSVLILFTIISVISVTPAFAEVTVEPAANSGTPGCEETAEGCYIPSTATVNVGEKVIFSNTDTAAHTFTSGVVSDADSMGAAFDSSLAMAGSSFEWSPTEAGEQPYFCTVHPWMTGLIIVEAEATEEALSETAEATEEALSETAEATEEALSETAEATEEALSETAEATEEALSETAEATEEALSETAEATEEALSETAEATEEALSETAEATEELASDITTDVEDPITNGEGGGGCLIATAAYGTELAPQVQFLREIRDNTVMSTASGTSFMTGFNQLYYLFSPAIADMERENPMFQQAVRAFITPMVSTLSIMTLADDGNEAEVLGLGISVIALNLGMYIAAPALIGFTVSKRLRK